MPPGICVVSQVNREKMPALVCPRFPHFLRMAPWPERSDGKGLSLFPILPKKTPLVIKERQNTTINLSAHLVHGEVVGGQLKEKGRSPGNPPCISGTRAALLPMQT